MQRRNEHDVIAFLELVLVLALKFPVRFVDENQNSWPPTLKPLPVSATSEFDRLTQCRPARTAPFEGPS
jgi:hypothetical protein